MSLQIVAAAAGLTRFPAATLWQWVLGTSLAVVLILAVVGSRQYVLVLVVAIALGHFPRGCSQGKCNMKPLSTRSIRCPSDSNCQVERVSDRLDGALTGVYNGI